MVVLLETPPADQREWKFDVPDQLRFQRHAEEPGRIYGKRVTFSAKEITLELGELPNNRILQDDDPSKFIVVSFKDLRIPDAHGRATGEYIQRLMGAGLYLDGTQYRFYHHSHNQLVSPVDVFITAKSHDIVAEAERTQLLYARCSFRCGVGRTNLSVGRFQENKQRRQTSVGKIDIQCRFSLTLTQVPRG